MLDLGKDRSAGGLRVLPDFCRQRAWSVEDTGGKLMAESQKVKSIRYRYALFTAKRAASVMRAVVSSGRQDNASDRGDGSELKH
jgi:hypothetical protein